MTESLNRAAAVILLGPRQAGKSTLARAIGNTRPSIFLDLEREADVAKLQEPELYLNQHADELVIIDEIQRAPQLFPALRVLIDEGRRGAKRTGRFLLLGSASGELLKQSSESLAGRAEYLELAPFDLLEIGEEGNDRLWTLGGFPESFLAADESSSFAWRQNFIRTYLERDIGQFAPRLPTETLRRFWTMLAHQQGGLFNASELARGLGVESKSTARYLDLLVDLFLVRRLPPFHANIAKRQIKSPKAYVRDSGLLHALLGIAGHEYLLGHPIAGPSWEGFVIENLISVAPPGTTPSFYRTNAGAEMDLVLELPSSEIWAIEVKRTLVPTPTKGFYNAIADLAPRRVYLVHAGTDRYPLRANAEVIGVTELAAELAAG